MRRSSVALWDIDNDKDLALLITGESVQGLVSLIFRNDDGHFTPVPLNLSLPGVTGGSVAWGDFDRDGWLDFVLAGATNEDARTAITQIYRNQQGQGFALAASLCGVYAGHVAWG